VKEITEACDDGKHDDKVTFDEFLHFYRKFLGSDEDKAKLKKKVNKKLNKKEYEEAHKKFTELDKDGNGTLDKKEFRNLLETLS